MDRKTYQGQLTNMPENGIFVFGSNTQGRHGKGAALAAQLNFGATYGKAMGLQGRSYGIVTKDLRQKIHPSVHPTVIEAQISILYRYAKKHPELDFYVAYSAVTQNLNGYTAVRMAEMFSTLAVPNNIIFEESFNNLINYDNDFKSELDL